MVHLTKGKHPTWLSVVCHLPHYSHNQSLSLSFSPHSSITMCNHNEIKIPIIFEFHYFARSSMIGRPQDFFWIFLPSKIFSTAFSRVAYLPWLQASLLYNHKSLTCTCLWTCRRGIFMKYFLNLSYPGAFVLRFSLRLHFHETPGKHGSSPWPLPLWQSGLYWWSQMEEMAMFPRQGREASTEARESSLWS